MLTLPLLAQANSDRVNQVDPSRQPAFNPDFSEFLDWVSFSIADRKIPGAALAIVSKPGVLLTRTWGVKEIGKPEAVAADSVFRIASMSKTFAGAAGTIMVNESHQSWDTLLTDYFPELHIGSNSSSKNITLRHVLSHSTGLMPHSYSNMLDAGVSYDRIKNQFEQIPTVCAPGHCYGYQNVVFSLVGDVIEENTGESYALYVEEKLFKPLGMTGASVGLQPYLDDAHATSPHRKVRGRWRPTSTNAAYYSTAPAAGINASVDDMALWLRANLGAFPDVLPPELLEQMQTPVIESPYGNYFNRWSGLEKAYYGIGWRVLDYRGVRVVHHGGGVRGYRSEMVFVPDAGLGMVLMFNGETNLANDVVPKFLDELLLPHQGAAD